MHNPAVYENRCMTYTSLQLFNIIKEKKKLLWNGQRQMLHLQTDSLGRSGAADPELKQRCTLTEDAQQHLRQKDQQISFSCPFFGVALRSWARLCEDRSLSRACGSSLDNEALRWGPLGSSRPNYTQRGLSTLVLTFDLFSPPCLKGAPLIVFTERCQTGRTKAR